MSKDFQNDPHAHVVYTPVIPRTGKDAQPGKGAKSCRKNRCGGSVGSTEREGRAVARPSQPKLPKPDPFLRAENEDDDGYDPYSDRPAPADPLFERDPWA